MEFEFRRYKTESAWQQGATAARQGVPRSANPYETHDREGDKYLDMIGWDNGWRFARAQEWKERQA